MHFLKMKLTPMLAGLSIAYASRVFVVKAV